MVAGSIASLSILKRAYFLFAIPALIPGSAYLIMIGDDSQTILGMGIMLYFVFTSFLAMHMYKTLSYNLAIRAENIRLTDELEKRTEDRIRELKTANEQLLQKKIELTKTEKQLRHSHEQLRNFAARLQVIRVLERENISRELHDQLGQTLTGLKIDLTLLKNKLPPDDELQELSQAILRDIDQTMDDIRSISADLRPTLLDGLGINAAIIELIKHFKERNSCDVTFENEVEALKLSNTQETVVFRVLQETLTNVARHAFAKNVQGKLYMKGHELNMEVIDDGAGIPEDKFTSNEALGLIGMRERANAVGGHLEISRVDASGGTRVALSILVEQ